MTLNWANASFSRAAQKFLSEHRTSPPSVLVTIKDGGTDVMELRGTESSVVLSSNPPVTDVATYTGGLFKFGSKNNGKRWRFVSKITSAQ